MKSITPGLFLLLLIIAVDLYTYKGLRLLTNGLKSKILRVAILSIFWLTAILTIAAIIWLAMSLEQLSSSRDYQTFFTIAGLVLLMVVPKIVFISFHFFEDVLFLLARLFKKGIPSTGAQKNTITRASFLTRIGLGLAAIPFLGMIYGMWQGRFDFRVVYEKIKSPRLHSAFNGFRIVQISDAHLGSFFKNYTAVEKGFEMINELKPDLILFTGDMVNNYADEMDGWEKYFESLKARYGKFAVLGNHDYGDYVSWSDSEEKSSNLRRLITSIESTGFKMLLNSSEIISINDQSIDLIGVENWGQGGFSKYGDLIKAKSNSHSPFKVLMSHDPSHWEGEVFDHPDIDLTLSGHTHGMQFGIEVPGIKWSPAQYRYPRWGGLYREKNQYLYVNRGFGYIGFPGRVGISPEITLIELQAD